MFMRSKLEGLILVPYSLDGGEIEMVSGKNLYEMWLNRQRLANMGVVEVPPWNPCRRRPGGIGDRKHTEEQASRPISKSSNLLRYIVRVRPPPNSSDDLLSYYQTFLPKTTEGEKSRIVHAYDIIFKGFSARLSPEEVKAMEKIPGFISAQVTRPGHFCSTHSNQNMGFLKDSNYGKGAIMTGWGSEWNKGSQIKTEEENGGGETNSSS